MDVDVTRDETKRAVWDFGSEKAPGLDGFTFNFFKKIWYLIEDDVVYVVVEFFSPGSFLRVVTLLLLL